MLHGNEDFKIGDGTWQQKLVETAHLGTVMGWNDPTTVRALDEFALMSVNEVVCGKVTPLTMKQARELPEHYDIVHGICNLQLASRESSTLLKPGGVILLRSRILKHL